MKREAGTRRVTKWEGMEERKETKVLRGTETETEKRRETQSKGEIYSFEINFVCTTFERNERIYGIKCMHPSV